MTTLSEFFDRTYYPRRLRGKSPHSTRLYQLTIRRFSESLGREPVLQDLTEDNLLIHLSRRSCVSAATRNKELSQLQAMWRLACQRGELRVWPTLRPEREPERAPVAWLADELQSLLTAAKRQDGDVAGVPAGQWWYGLIRVLLDTGERISAGLAIEWSWLSGSTLTIPAEARKGRTRDKQHRLSDETVKAMAAIRSTRANDVRVFPWELNHNYIWNRYARIIKQAGLPATRIHKFHCLRKTCGSAVYAAGMDPQEVLDHADRRTTQRYLDARFSRERSACDVLGEFLANPTKRSQSQRKTG